MPDRVQRSRRNVLCGGRVDLWRGHSRCRRACCGDRMQQRPRRLHVVLLGCDWSGGANARTLSPVLDQASTALFLPNTRHGPSRDILWRAYIARSEGAGERGALAWAFASRVLNVERKTCYVVQHWKKYEESAEEGL